MAVPHEVQLEVDLNRLRTNAGIMASLVRPARLLAVVKSDGYGHGAAQAATAFLAGGAEELAVSTVAEAITLREAGFSCPILTLTEPRLSDVSAVVELGLGATVFTDSILKSLEDAARRADARAHVHIKVDTGTRRAGCPPETLRYLVSRVRESSGLTLDSVWSQFAAASDQEPSETATSALELFLHTLNHAGVPAGIRRHIANSAAAVSMPNSRMDLVRSGIGLYGYSSQSDQSVRERLGLAPALRLLANVRSVRQVSAGDWAGYGQPRILESDTAIANVGVGYAHGIPRTWGINGGWVKINGKRFPILGPVSMEQMLIDLGAPGDSGVNPGDQAVILGDGNSGPDAAEIAAACDSIPNEILCRIGLTRTSHAYIGD